MDRIATESVLARRVTGGVNTTVTQWSHSHAVPTTYSPVRRGANLRKEEEGNVTGRSRRGRDTVVTGAHALELCSDGDITNTDPYPVRIENWCICDNGLVTFSHVLRYSPSSSYVFP